jgi:hypothetical protein
MTGHRTTHVAARAAAASALAHPGAVTRVRVPATGERGCGA